MGATSDGQTRRFRGRGSATTAARLGARRWRARGRLWSFVLLDLGIFLLFLTLW